MSAARASRIALLAVLVFDVWFRCHTLGPTLRDRFGLTLYPVVAGESEPLDCDESIYAYIGKRIVAGDVMYRDLTENKPPLGYWLYALGVRIGGTSETAIRLLPVPFVLLTIAICWWTAGRLGGPMAAVVAAIVFALMSTDPYLYGNGANMEHFLNLFTAAAMMGVVEFRHRPRRRMLILAGMAAAAACLVKQVAGASVPVYLLAAWFGRDGDDKRSTRLADVGAFVGGFGAIVAAAFAVLLAQGAGPAAYDDIVRYGGALAADTPSDPKEYPFFLRAFVGNTDPVGRLPWPFGRTEGRAWWAAGSWPLWAASVPAVGWLLMGRRGGSRRWVAAWTLSLGVQVAAPRLFWQHYYLLAVPGVAACVGIAAGDAVASLRATRGEGRKARLVLLAAVATGLLGSVVGTAEVLRRDYLGHSPETLTSAYKGGTQWVVLRQIGREIGRRASGWSDPRMFVWGIQSPLYFYSGLDGVTPQVFADPLIVAYSHSDRPLIRPRIERTLRDLEAHPPDVIFVGERPFPSLEAFLRHRYLVSALVPRGGLWIRRDRFADFESPSKQ